MSALRDHDWQASYSHEDGDIASLFFDPALERAKLYQRVTGYFSANVLALAARGLGKLIDGGGRMQLIVGCTLQAREVEEIEKGYGLRDMLTSQASERWKLEATDDLSRERLGWLAWLVAHGHLDIKLAVPKDEHGRFGPGLGLFHAKAGLLTDDIGDKLLFNGSINETDAGWMRNVESFTVSCSWRGPWDVQRIDRQSREFEALWNNRARSAEVLDFPEACRLELLKYLPQSDEFVSPPALIKPDVAAAANDELRRRMWHFIKSAPSRPDGAMVAVCTSAIDPWPHQIRAYERMLTSWPCRLLIADEVGLGKTIEAGLLIRHAWISGLAKRILVLVPAAVLPQWQAELYEKFNLLVPIYTGDSLVRPVHHGRVGELEREVARGDWTKEPLVLASSHLVRRNERQGDLIDAEDWDLLVLDEAHHARRRGAGTKNERGPNRLLTLMRRIKAKAKSLLLLTATPMQVDPVEIWDLIDLLGQPSEWTDSAFRDYFETLDKNPDAKEMHRIAALLRVTERAFGPMPTGEVERVAKKHSLSKLAAEEALAALREPDTTIRLRRLSNDQRQAALALLRVGTPLRARMLRNTRGLLREYHRRGLLLAPIAERNVADIAVDMAPAERRLYEQVEDYISSTYAAAAQDKKTAVGFVMTVYRRRLASSFFALRRTLNRRLDQLSPASHGPEIDWSEDVSDDETADESLAAEEGLELATKALAAEESDNIRALLRDIAKLGTDSKALRVIDEITTQLAEQYDAAIVFTQYTDTMEYLRDLLSERLDVPIGCFSGNGGLRRDLGGNWNTCSKETIKRLLKTREIRVLICTDAAGEGLNLQSCGFLINYDLPWNPMKVEQRIGRIDRIGQARARIRVANFAYKDTVEADVYFALQQRIGLFTGVVGKLQPILSRLPQRFEKACLTPSVDRDRVRRELLDNLDSSVDEALERGFDIDEVSDADLSAPALPPSPVDPVDIERIMLRREWLPPGVESAPLEGRTFTVRVPGSKVGVRTTATPQVFDEHFESLQLLAYGSPIFAAVLDLGATGDSPMDTPEISWLHAQLQSQRGSLLGPVG